jgi:hypothetical protein
MLLATSGLLLGDSVRISPYKIILNAQGQAEDVLAIMPMSMPAGYLFEDGNASLSLNGEFVAEAISMRYCYVDDNLLISFDREQLLNHPIVISLAGSTATATVEGSFTAVNADGQIYTRTFSASDLVEILSPGKAGENAK